jgi:phage-related protein
VSNEAWVTRCTRPSSGKTFLGEAAQTFLRGGVLEIVEDHDGETYRAIYTVKFEDVIYVLHAFQEKSKQGVATSQSDIDLIRRRLRMAKELHARRGR